MAKRRPSARMVKQHRSYTIAEAAECLDISTGTIRRWIKGGLPILKGQKPFLITGSALKHFLERQATQKQRCGSHELFCLRCRTPRAAAGGLIDYVPKNDRTGQLSAICDTCSTMMYKSFSAARLPELMAKSSVSFPQGTPHLIDRVQPSSNDHFDREASRDEMQ